MKLSSLTPVLLGAALAFGSVAFAQPCTFTARGASWVLDRDCVTPQTVIIPEGFTLDGNGHQITAVDPPGGSFTGAVVRNGGARASVVNLRVSARDLAVVCHAGAERLRGILLDGASGSVSDNAVLAVNQGASGCQEGQGIEIRNTAPGAPVKVTVERNAVSDYQKTGILAVGNVDVTVRDNAVIGGGPVAHIARNGIQLGFGATGKVHGNQVTGNSYAGSGWVASGIQLTGGAYYSTPLCVGVQIDGNVLVDNDVGVLLAQFGADGAAPTEPTRTHVINNDISMRTVSNGNVYQAGISVAGNGDLLIANRISGAGYDPATLPGETFRIDAQAPYATRTRAEANK